jgi:hypothetical protein
VFESVDRYVVSVDILLIPSSFIIRFLRTPMPIPFLEEICITRPLFVFLPRKSCLFKTLIMGLSDFLKCFLPGLSVREIIKSAALI